VNQHPVNQRPVNQRPLTRPESGAPGSGTGQPLPGASRAGFIRDNTRVHAPPHVPEIRLHLADEAVPLWQATEEELEAKGLPPPFWAFAWAGGQALARHVLDHPGLVAQAEVLDLASGSGLVAIAAAKAGARHVLAADIDVFSQEAIAINAALNAAPVDVTGDDLIGTAIRQQVILVGDLFYERDLAGRLMVWLEQLAAEGRTVLVGDPGRAYLPKDRLKLLACYEVPVTRELEDAEVKQTRVWSVPRGTAPSGI
jgi:predicted nicotinamide N-methyase